mmetsp:Transcript_36910/g.66893  ORF Transcript_36910/g.66893 Transcript_36910/m.66893 type:complete len:98 (-) Transcript_36910:591-884(-)
MSDAGAAARSAISPAGNEAADDTPAEVAKDGLFVEVVVFGVAVLEERPGDVAIEERPGEVAIEERPGEVAIEEGRRRREGEVVLASPTCMSATCGII